MVKEAMNRMTSIIRPTAFALSLIVSCACLSQAGDEVDLIRPPHSDRPTKAYVAVVLLDIDEIDSAKQSFTANFIMEVRWHDRRLAHPGPGEAVRPLAEIWHPQLLFVNQQKIWPAFPEVAHITPDGEATYLQQVWGPFSQPLDVTDFPFDTQDFVIRVAGLAGRGEVVFEADPRIKSKIADRFSLPDWDILRWELDFSIYSPTESSRGAPSFALVLHAKRHASHYAYKVILPLILIVAMSWIVFWVDPAESGTQIGVATTSMLTLIAYRFMVGNMMPPVPYLTRMDYFILGSTILVFAALVQAVVTSRMAHRQKSRMARRVDVWCRVIFPILFACIVFSSLII